ncbi:MAG: hypothetical protein BWZ10_02770 [candidate division BRC1 bacterium ADurb.BinA364]|nr:MAG: hypothetical protein BWZ10_02770 [candidate division BRC1 bacterium ADurb.BinA364]
MAVRRAGGRSASAPLRLDRRRIAFRRRRGAAVRIVRAIRLVARTKRGSARRGAASAIRRRGRFARPRILSPGRQPAADRFRLGAAKSHAAANLRIGDPLASESDCAKRDLRSAHPPGAQPYALDRKLACAGQLAAGVRTRADGSSGKRLAAQPGAWRLPRLRANRPQRALPALLWNGRFVFRRNRSGRNGVAWPPRAWLVPPPRDRPGGSRHSAVRRHSNRAAVSRLAGRALLLRIHPMAVCRRSAKRACFRRTVAGIPAAIGGANRRTRQSAPPGAIARTPAPA